MAIKRFQVGPRMSDAVVCNGIAFLAGQVAEDASQDITGQTKQVLAAIDELLGEVGSDKSRLISANIFLADMKDFSAMNAVWDAWVSKGNTPARATVQAQLAQSKWRIEIVATAEVG